MQSMIINPPYYQSMGLRSVLWVESGIKKKSKYNIKWTYSRPHLKATMLAQRQHEWEMVYQYKLFTEATTKKDSKKKKTKRKKRVKAT